MTDELVMRAWLREKWRGTLSNDTLRSRFDALVDRFDAADRNDQDRTGAVALTMAVAGGPMSPLHAAYLNYCLDVGRAADALAKREGKE